MWQNPPSSVKMAVCRTHKVTLRSHWERGCLAHGLCTILYNLNVTGTTNSTGTSTPPCLPGIHLGIEPTTRIASLSREGETDLTTRTFDIAPSHSTTNDTITRP